jgi:hypothetical protein
MHIDVFYTAHNGSNRFILKAIFMSTDATSTSTSEPTSQPISLPLQPQCFCRGCGQLIHSSALSCPSCGAVQSAMSQAVPIAPMQPTNSPQTTLGIVSCVLGAVMFALVWSASDAPWGHDEWIGFVFLLLIAGGCSSVSLFTQKPRQITAVIGLVCAGLGLLIAIGNF